MLESVVLALPNRQALVGAHHVDAAPMLPHPIDLPVVLRIIPHLHTLHSLLNRMWPYFEGLLRKQREPKREHLSQLTSNQDMVLINKFDG